MSTQRYIDTSFWDDAWVQELDPSEKLLYIYLLTNPLTNIAGVMELTVKRMCFDTGFNSDTVGHILSKFERANKVYKYENYIIIRNFPKHQQLENEKIVKGIATILSKLPNDVLAYLEQIGYEFDIKGTFDTLCIPYTYPTNYLNLKEFNTNSNLNIKADKPAKQKKLPLSEREPENDYEVIEKSYLNLWTKLYNSKKVNTSNPIITNKDWCAIRKLEQGLLQSIPVNVIKDAVLRAENNEFIQKNGYSFRTILSGNVINQLINGFVESNTSKNKSDFNKKSLDSKISLEETEWQ